MRLHRLSIFRDERVTAVDGFCKIADRAPDIRLFQRPQLCHKLPAEPDVVTGNPNNLHIPLIQDDSNN